MPQPYRAQAPQQYAGQQTMLNNPNFGYPDNPVMIALNLLAQGQAGVPAQSGITGFAPLPTDQQAGAVNPAKPPNKKYNKKLQQNATLLNQQADGLRSPDNQIPLTDEQKLFLSLVGNVSNAAFNGAGNPSRRATFAKIPGSQY